MNISLLLVVLHLILLHNFLMVFYADKGDFRSVLLVISNSLELKGRVSSPIPKKRILMQRDRPPNISPRASDLGDLELNAWLFFIFFSCFAPGIVS